MFENHSKCLISQQYKELQLIWKGEIVHVLFTKWSEFLILKKLGRTLANENKNKISKPQKKRFHDKKQTKTFLGICKYSGSSEWQQQRRSKEGRYTPMTSKVSYFFSSFLNYTDFSAKCTELPEAPENGLVVAPNLEHGMVGKFECHDGYMLKGHNTTQCFFGNWTGMTPWCKEVFCPFPGFVENGKVLLVGAMGLYEYRPYVRKIRNNRQIMFQCDRDYELVGGPTGATCIDGHWSPPQLPR